MDKTRIVPTKSRDKFCFEIFFSVSRKSRKIPSAPDLFTRPASIVAKGFHLQFQGFILSHIKSLELLSKRQFSLSRKLISVQLHGSCSLYDEWLTRLSRFCLFSRFCPIFTREKFCLWCFWRFVRFGQNLSSRDKPHVLVRFVANGERPQFN